MSMTEILLAAILVGVMALVSLGVMSIMSKHHWETRSRLEKAKKIDSVLSNIIKSNKAVICEVMMPPMQELVPRVQTQMNKDGTFEPAMLDNMYPFILKDELKVIRQRLLSID